MMEFVLVLLALGFSAVLAANGPCDLPQYCTPSQVLGCMNSIDFGSTYYKEALDDIIKLVEPYVYLDILKNPPQPKGFNDYFKPVDLISELRKVKTEGTNFYEFYRSVQKALKSTQDGHFGFFFEGNKDYNNMLNTFHLIPPLKLFTATQSNNMPGMKGTPWRSEFYNNFPNGPATKAIIERNKNNFIVSINGMSPFDFILTFGSEYYNSMKNKDAKYTYASNTLFNYPSLSDLPMLERDFTMFTVVYSNGDSFTSPFYFWNMNAMETKQRSDNDSLKEFARELLENYTEGTMIGYQDGIRVYNNSEKPEGRKPLTEIDVVEALKNYDFEKRRQSKIEKNTSTKVVRTTTNAVAWDHSTHDSILKCRVDDMNRMDVFFINSFSPEDTNEFIDILIECKTMFDENEYPIVVIDNFNTGGALVLSAVFQEILQLDMVSRIFMSFKNNEKTNKAIKPYVETGLFQNPATGKTVRTVEELMEGPEVDIFGNGVYHVRSKPMLAVYSSTRGRIDKIKPEFKRNRKPTEIVVFTDSFSFSAGSFLTKGLKEAGAAIIVGYNGYPGSKKDTFDIGQSPTMVLQTNLDIHGKDEYNRLKEKGILYACMSVGETFRRADVENGINPLVPREFLFDAPDERVAIYSAYDDSKYEVFMNAAKDVLEKYVVGCNPNNLGLHMRNVLCDAKINKAHMHGGYVCGADGKWSTTCEGYFCDDGYYFDTKTKECVADVFYGESSSTTISIWALLLVLAFVLF